MFLMALECAVVTLSQRRHTALRGGCWVSQGSSLYVGLGVVPVKSGSVVVALWRCHDRALPRADSPSFVLSGACEIAAKPEF